MSATVYTRMAHVLAAALDRQFPGRKHEPAAFRDVVLEMLAAARGLDDCGAGPIGLYQFGDLIVDSVVLRAHWRGCGLNLTQTQIRLLAQLLSVRLTPATVLARVLGQTSSTASLRVTITKLRDALPPEIEIEAVYRRGYRIRVNGELLI